MLCQAVAKQQPIGQHEALGRHLQGRTSTSQEPHKQHASHGAESSSPRPRLVHAKCATSASDVQARLALRWRYFCSPFVPQEGPRYSAKAQCPSCPSVVSGRIQMANLSKPCLLYVTRQCTFAAAGWIWHSGGTVCVHQSMYATYKHSGKINKWAAIKHDYAVYSYH